MDFGVMAAGVGLGWLAIWLFRAAVKRKAARKRRADEMRRAFQQAAVVAELDALVEKWLNNAAQLETAIREDLEGEDVRRAADHSVSVLLSCCFQVKALECMRGSEPLATRREVRHVAPR